MFRIIFARWIEHVEQMETAAPTHCRCRSRFRLKVLTYGICYLFCHGILHPIYGYLWQYHKNQRLRLLMMVFLFALHNNAQPSTHLGKSCVAFSAPFILSSKWFASIIFDGSRVGCASAAIVQCDCNCEIVCVAWSSDAMWKPLTMASIS